ncbi:microtubule-associated serine/threonine-protein kinase 2-like isoform X4 [Symsagittifera roscoffensis]|uniref:microtubule-associated serine/threonine-protein kinase 2-like isoform X4 n=1 Tax=Symsagittifera roscoffensis TaxID=84072 RepID=UPI00307BF853
MESKNQQTSRRSRQESISGGNSSHDLAYRIRCSDKSRDGTEKDNSIGCNLVAMVRLAFSDPVLYRSPNSISDCDFTQSDEYGSNKGLATRAGVAASCAGIPRRISFRGRKRWAHSSKISLIASPASHHNSMANMYPLPSPTGMGSEIHDRRRWSLSFSGRNDHSANKHNFDMSSNFGTPLIVASSHHELGGNSSNQSFKQQASILSLTAQLQQLDFDTSIHQTPTFHIGSGNNTLVHSNNTPICSPCLTPASDHKNSCTGSETNHSSGETTGSLSDVLGSSQGRLSIHNSSSGTTNACRSLSYNSGASSASSSSTDAFNLLGSAASSSSNSAATALHINCGPSLLQFATSSAEVPTSLSLGLAREQSHHPNQCVAGPSGVGSSSLSVSASHALSGLAVSVSPSMQHHMVNSPMKPRARSLSPTRNTLTLDTSIHLMNDMYRERFPNAISQMEDKLSEFLSTNGGVITPSATSTAIAGGAGYQQHNHGVGFSSSPSTPLQQSGSRGSAHGEGSSQQATPPPSKSISSRLSSPANSNSVATSPLLVSTPPPPESDPVVSFVSHQILKLAKDCLDKSTEKILTGAYFNELCIKVEKLLSDAMDRVENARQLEPVLQRGNKLLSIVSRPARLLECLEFDPEVFYSRLESGQELAPVQWDLAERMNKDLPSYILRLLGEKRDINRLSFYDSGGGYDSGRPNTPDTDESEPVPRALPGEADFEQIKLISNGAYGAVYLVRHKLTKQRFAEKRIKKQDLVLRNMLDQVFAERDILMFAQNPFVVSMYCSFETKKHLCMIMEYVDGGDVGTLLKNVGALPYDLARMYFAETVLAVEYLHSYGIVHRDLKPDNLLITSEGHIKLTDFGLSRMGLMSLACNIYEDLSRPGMFNDGQIIGTPEYIAPECFQKRAYGKPVDWWSCGVILYELLMGDTPFYGDTPEELFDHALSMPVEWPPISEEGDEYPPFVAQSIVEDLLVKDPINRRGTGGAVELKNHPFFNELDWNALLKQKAEFIPLLEGDEDTSYFDTRSDRYNHDDSVSDTDSDEDVCDSSSVSLQSQLSSSFSACSPRYQRMCSASIASPSASASQSASHSAGGSSTNSTGTGSHNNSSCSSPQPAPIQASLKKQTSPCSSSNSVSAPVSTSSSLHAITVQGASSSVSQKSAESPTSGSQLMSKGSNVSTRSSAGEGNHSAAGMERCPVATEKFSGEKGMGDRQQSATELNSSFEADKTPDEEIKNYTVKSSSDSKLSKSLAGLEKAPAMPPRSAKPIRYVPEHLQKPIHVDSGVDSSGGCHTPDETPSPVIPPRDFTPKVMSGSNGTGNQSTTRDFKRFSATQMQKFFQPKPKLPPNAALFSPTTPTKPSTKHPGLNETEERKNDSNLTTQAESSSEISTTEISDSLVQVELKTVAASYRELEFELSMPESIKDLSISSADERNSAASSLNTSLCVNEESSATSSESCNDHTLTSATGADLSKQLTAKLAETLKLELSESSIEKEYAEARKKSSASKAFTSDHTPSNSSKKSKSSHSASRKLASSSKHSAASVKLSETLPGKSNSVHRHDKVSIGAGVSAKISPNDFGDAKLAQTDCAKPSSSSSLLRIMVPNSSGEYEDSTTPSALRKSQAGVKMQHSRHGETSSSHISRRHMTTPPSAETRNKSPSPNGKRSGGSGNKGKSSPISSDTSPDRLSGSNSTLKSTQPKCQDTLTGSSGGNDFKDEDYPRDFTLPASVPGSSGSSGSTPQVVNKSKLSGGGPNCGPIFPRIPIRDALPVIKRGNRGYGFHMKAIKVYSMQSEDFTIQHLVTYVDPSGPAYQSGLKENDLITHIGGQSIQGMAHTEVVYLIIQSRDLLLIQATPLLETSIKNDCARRKGMTSSTSNQSGSSFLSGRLAQSHIYGSVNPASSISAASGTSGSSVHHSGSKSKKSRSSRAQLSSRTRGVDKPQIIKPKLSSRDIVHPNPAHQPHPFSDQPTHVFPATATPPDHIPHKQKNHSSKYKKYSQHGSNDPYLASTHAYSQINDPLVAPVFTTAPTTSGYHTGTLPKSRSAHLTGGVAMPSPTSGSGCPGITPADSVFPGEKSSCMKSTDAICHASCCKARAGIQSVTSCSSCATSQSQMGPVNTLVGMAPQDAFRPQKLKLGPKGVTSSGRRKSGNNIPVSPLARTPSPSRTKSVNASPSLVTSECVSGSGGVTVMQRKGGGAITCPSLGSRSVNVSPQAHAAFSSSSPSPSGTSKLVSGGSSDGYQSSPILTQVSPKLDQPPPVPARIPVASTCYNNQATPACASYVETFASSSPAVLRSLSRNHDYQVAGVSGIKGVEPISKSQTVAVCESSTTTIMSKCGSQLGTNTKKADTFGSSVSTPCQMLLQSASLPTNPNIINQASSSTFLPPQTELSSATVAVGQRSWREPQDMVHKIKVAGITTGANHVDPMDSGVAQAQVTSSSGSSCRPSLPPRSPSN